MMTLIVWYMIFPNCTCQNSESVVDLLTPFDQTINPPSAIYRVIVEH